MSINNNYNEKHWQLLVLVLKEIASEKKVTHEQISDATGLSKSNVSRFFTAKHKPGLDIFLKIASIIKVNFFIEDQESKTELNQIFDRAMRDLGRRS